MVAPALTTTRRISAIVLAGLVLASCGDDGGALPTAATNTGTTADSAGRSVPASALTTIDELMAAMGDDDLDALVELATGPAAAFFTIVRHGHLTAGPGAEPVFPNFRVEPSDPSLVEPGVVRLPGPAGYAFTGPGAPPPRVFTDLEFHEIDGTWKLRTFLRNGVPIDEWVTRPPIDPVVTSGPISIRSLGRFIDIGCQTGSDPNCPAAARDVVAVNFVISSDASSPLEFVPSTLPDGTQAPGWLESATGAAHVPSDAQSTPLEPGAMVLVTAHFVGVDDPLGPSTLHVTFRVEGELHQLGVPVPGFPGNWDTPG